MKDIVRLVDALELEQRESGKKARQTNLGELTDKDEKTIRRAVRRWAKSARMIETIAG